jgi:hypothetical protein
MRHILTLLGFGLVFALACVAAPQKARVDGHGDGEITIPITFIVIDAKTHAPIAGANVRFYNQMETVILKAIELEKKRSKAATHAEPNGTSDVTDESGHVTLKCRFDAAFLWSYESGSKKDVGIDIFPTGRFIASKNGYIGFGCPAEELLPDQPYSPEQLAKPVTLQLTTEPNQALQHNDPSCHAPCVRTCRASRGRG